MRCIRLWGILLRKLFAELEDEVWGHFAVLRILEGTLTLLCYLALDCADDIHLPEWRCLPILKAFEVLSINLQVDNLLLLRW